MDLHEWQEIFKKGGIVHHKNGGSGEIRCLQNSGDSETGELFIEATIKVSEATVFNPIRRIPIQDLMEYDNYVETCPDCDGKKEVGCICHCGNEHLTTCPKCEGEGYIKKQEV